MPTEIAIISGKGGTGKTTIVASFVAFAKDAVIADCDVDAPDLHILLEPETHQSNEFIGSKTATIDEESCDQCKICESYCRFDAIRVPEIDPMACEGCGVCAFVCPQKAITLHDSVSGYTYQSTTRYGSLSHAKLLPGQGNSGKLVTEVRKHAQAIARDKGTGIIIDGSPGIGCPVISTVAGVKLGVIVTEPTLSGIHDMKRVLSLLQQFNVPPAIIINKADINNDRTDDIIRYCEENGIEILGELPFDSIMTKSMVYRKTMPEFAPDHPITHKLEAIWYRIKQLATT